MKQRSQLHSLIVALVFLYAEVNPIFHVSRVAQGSDVLKVFGASSQILVTVPQVSIVHSGCTFDGVFCSATSCAQKDRLVSVLRVKPLVYRILLLSVRH